MFTYPIETDFGITFKEVNKSFNIPLKVNDIYNPDDYIKSELEKELKAKAEQIGLHDFIDISFPNATGYFCFFQKSGKKKENGKIYKRHLFFTKEQLKQKLDVTLYKSFGLNTYVSYSTYYKKMPEYQIVASRIRFSDGTYSMACDIKTKKEFFVREDIKKMKARRTQSNIVKTYLLAQDLDYYKLGISDAEAIARIANLVKEEKIICPTFFVFTGRGIQLIWAVRPFKNIKGYTHDKEWRKIQNEMISIFDEVGLNPDSVVKNPSAVTRLDETLNYKARDIVRVFYTNAAHLTLDDFVFHHGLFPQPDKKQVPKKSQKMGVIIHFPIKKAKEILEEVKKEWKEHYHITDKILEKMNWNLQTLNEARIDDIFTYVDIFKERGIPLIAKRNWLALLVAFHTLIATNGDGKKAYENVVALWDKFPDQSETDLEEIVRRGYDEAVKKYNDWVNDTWDRETYVQGGLFYTNKRLLEIMGISKAYDIQLKLSTIKIRNKEYEAYRKRVEKYGEEEAENHTWEAYQQRRNTKLAEQGDVFLWQLQKAIERHPEWTHDQLAKHLGVTSKTIQRWKKKL